MCGSDLWVGEGKTVQFPRFYIVMGECFNVKLTYCHHILVWLILQGTKTRRTLLCQQCSIETRTSKKEHLYLPFPWIREEAPVSSGSALLWLFTSLMFNLHIMISHCTAQTEDWRWDAASMNLFTLVSSPRLQQPVLSSYCLDKTWLHAITTHYPPPLIKPLQLPFITLSHKYNLHSAAATESEWNITWDFQLLRQKVKMISS